jgi:hypothetical protein
MMKRALCVTVAFALLSDVADAQSYNSGGTTVQVSGTFTSSIGGFTPAPAYLATPLAISTASARVALPGGTVAIVYNTGSNAAYVTLGNSSVVATTTDDVVQPNSWMAFTVGANTYLAAITSTGTTSLNISGGSGMPTGAGGGGGGGSGGTVTQGAAAAPSGAWPVSPTVLGAAVSASNPLPMGFGSGVTLPAFTSTPTVNLGTIAAVATAANQPALSGDGGALAHVTNFPSTQAVSWSAQSISVTSLPSLPAGTNPIGTVTSQTAASASQWRGSSGAQTGTGAVSVSNSSLASNYTYITDLECGRSDAATAALTITLNDGATTVLVVPNSGGGGGWTKTFATPLKVSGALGAALTVTAGSAVTSYYCSAQGFFATN